MVIQPKYIDIVGPVPRPSEIAAFILILQSFHPRLEDAWNLALDWYSVKASIFHSVIWIQVNKLSHLDELKSCVSQGIFWHPRPRPAFEWHSRSSHPIVG